MSYFEDITFTGLGHGRLILREEGLLFKEASGGAEQEIEKSDIASASWSTFGRTGHLRLVVKVCA